MKNLFWVFILVFLVACGASRRAADIAKSDTPAPISGPEGLKGKILKPISEEIEASNFTNMENVGSIMNFLASDELKGRDTGTEEIAKAAYQIAYNFKENGVAPYFETYYDTLVNHKKPAFNVVGWVEGSDSELKKEFIVIGAHYDHIGTVKPVNGDYIANGANDNASGTTTVMELARYFGTAKSNKRSLIFALFSAEEKGLLGSEHLAKKMKEEDLNLYVMLNFEMTGVSLRSKKYALYITGFEKSNLAEVSNKYAGESLIGYLPTAKQYGLFQRSDNYPFHQIFGVPSHTYCTFDFTNFDFYHKPGDEVEQMDFEHMAKVVNKMIPVVEGIANAPTQEIIMN